MITAGIVSAMILAAAVALDMLLGDPRWLPHPIRWMGTAISTFEPRFRRLPLGLTAAGCLFAVSLIVGAWCLTWLAVGAAQAIHPVLAVVLEVVIIAYSLSSRSLAAAAIDVRRSLDFGRIDEARQKVSMIVGRETAGLNEQGIARATVETVAENLVDGFIAPLFYASLGGAPFAMAYKMINTLDSMVGYKNDAYRRFGKAAARIDDGANFIPARLAVPIIGLAAQVLADQGKRSVATARAEGSHHTSPNAGYAEAAFAGALGIKLIGPAVYHGRKVDKPFIGKAFGPTGPAHITRACDLMLLSAVLWTAVAVGIRLMTG
jgi:adenosylcobinamide-phosphate synthase